MTPLLTDLSVNGATIPAALIAAEAQNHPAPPGKPGLAWRAAGRALVVRTLLMQEATARGLAPEPREIAPGQIETDEEALLRQVLDQAVVPAPVSAAEVERAYAARPDLFRAPALYEAAHILLPLSAPEQETAVLAEAQAICTELSTHSARFADIARQRSACQSAQNGGRLGQITQGDTVPEFEAALAAMSEGTINPAPVRSRYGFHIIRLDARAEGNILPFDRVEQPLRRAMEKRAWSAAAQAYIEGLIARADIAGITLINAA